MKIRVFRSGKGDSLLLTSEGGGAVLVDGGVPNAYGDHLAAHLGRMRDRGEKLALVCVSHIDRDHIGGVLRMLDNEVAWRVHEHHGDLPARLRPRSNRRPALKRPPEIDAIWHNAFFEEVRRIFITTPGPGTSLDMTDVLFRTADVVSGARNQSFSADGPAAAQIASEIQFLGQSVGDAIEVSRRISDGQLKIALNPEFDGDFVLRADPVARFPVGGFDVRVLGPTAGELEKLIGDWNAWLRKNADFLKNKLLKRHDRDADRLGRISAEDIVAMAGAEAFAFAGNQNVTPPNLASIILYVEDAGDGRSILLTGDADDPSILAGLEAADLVDDDGNASVEVFKVPHHGAHNSFSEELARRVRARHYVFCGDGEHDNPEPDIIEGYLEALFEGVEGHPPALGGQERARFWFNCGPELEHKDEKLRKHWKEIERRLNKWRNRHNRFSFWLTKSGDSFLVS